MLALGFILVVLATGAILAVVVGGNEAATVDLGVLQVQSNTLGVFLMGAATVLLLVLGVNLMRTGLRRIRRQRQERRELSRLNRKLEQQQTAETPARTDDHPSDTLSHPEPGDHRRDPHGPTP